MTPKDAAKQLAMIKDGLDISGVPSFEGTEYAVNGDIVARVWYLLLSEQKDKDKMLAAAAKLKNNETTTGLKP